MTTDTKRTRSYWTILFCLVMAFTVALSCDPEETTDNTPTEPGDECTNGAWQCTADGVIENCINQFWEMQKNCTRIGQVCMTDKDEDGAVTAAYCKETAPQDGGI